MKKLVMSIMFLSACAHAQETELPVIPTFDYASHQILVEHYLDALVANDTETIAAQFSDDIVINDPTIAVLTGEPMQIVGKEAFIAYHKPLTQFAEEIQIDLESTVFAADYAVVDYTLTVLTKGEALRAPHIKSVPLVYDTTSIVRFADGKIVQIADYTDFEAVKETILSLPSER